MAVKNGTASSDVLYANQNDQVFGLEGDDILDASSGQGNNLLDGGSGNDKLFASNNDTLKGGGWRR
jgi:Ca2+-binding RTX toxin-like protein